LTLWFSAIFLGGFALFGCFLWVDLAYSLSQGRDRTLTRRATRIAEMLDAANANSPASRESRFEQLTDVIPEGNLIQVFDISGARVLPRNSSAPGFPWPARVAATDGDEFSSVEYSGRMFRLCGGGGLEPALTWSAASWKTTAT
jgi:hypothetical protein